jgi:hypothetical protein
MVYRGNPDAEFEDLLRLHMQRTFGAKADGRKSR